jgi:two-component system OmpR family response regulator
MSTPLDTGGDINVAIVDDDDVLRTEISSYLNKNGYTAHAAASATELDDVLSQIDIDIIILDVVMPGEDGLSVCRRIAQNRGPAVILLSGMGDEIDRIVGLEMGADDYIAKPCHPRELLARIRAVLRRRSEDYIQSSRRTKMLYKFSGFLLDISRRELKAPDGTIILLTEREFSVLGIFLSSPMTVLSRDELIESTYGPNSTMDDRAIDVLVGRLRRKLEASYDRPLIKTHRGAGYMFACDVSKA